MRLLPACGIIALATCLVCVASACSVVDPAPDPWHPAGEAPLFINAQQQVGTVRFDTASVTAADVGQVQWRAIARVTQPFDSVVISLQTYGYQGSCGFLGRLIATASARQLRAGDEVPLSSGIASLVEPGRYFGRMLYARAAGSVKGTALGGVWSGKIGREGTAPDTSIAGFIDVDGRLQLDATSNLAYISTITGTVSDSGAFVGAFYNGCPGADNRRLRTPSGQPLTLTGNTLSGVLIDSTFGSRNGQFGFVSTRRYAIQLQRTP